MVYRLGVELKEQGQHLVAHPVAGVGGVGVALVLHMGDVAAAEVVLHLLPGHLQHGADEHPLPGLNAPQALEARASDEVHEHRLRLVPGVVSGGNEGVTLPPGGVVEKGIAQGPGGLLHPLPPLGGSGGHVPVAHMKGDLVAFTPRADKVLLPVGGLADAVVEVGGPHLVAALLCPVQEAAEQIHGVRSPGHRAQHPVPGGNQVVGKQLCHQ